MKLRRLIILLLASALLPISPATALETRTIDVVALTWPGATAPVVSVNDVANAIKSEVATRWNYLAQNWPGRAFGTLTIWVATAEVGGSATAGEATTKAAALKQHEDNRTWRKKRLEDI